MEFKDITHGMTVNIEASIIQIFGNEQSDRGNQAFSVKLKDGQSIHTNIQNLSPSVAAPITDEAALDALDAKDTAKAADAGKHEAEVKGLNETIKKITKERDEFSKKAADAEALCKKQALEIQQLEAKAKAKAEADKKAGK